MDELEIQLKRLGKKKILRQKVILTGNIKTLEDLIIQLVTHNVNSFNKEIEKNKVLSFLSPSEIHNQSITGKIGFGEIENETKANINSSIENALQAFEDGIYAVFIDDDEVQTLKELLAIKESSSITFIRMTFLTGTYW
ncbi:hypothetical protein BTO06_08740 [Tenacibaculum sp. SZ-18]|uniref:hypothetical protein n=1 Tax=Tenacibaculum sp. SZ-18 TaxID=754423 RepID=UPI000C2CED93|nr:hypothetical protein [Tenacibaculum sp. SZ-18]AUC15218.1 hypothetical protein BTO06_08740 [Tenacibaculum sp. SZ-18]